MTTNNNKGNVISHIFSGVPVSNLLSNHRWYLAFLAMLALFYISFHNNMTQTVRKTRELEKYLQNLHAEYATLSSRLMQLNKQSTITRMLNTYDITTVAPPKTPPKRIK